MAAQAEISRRSEFASSGGEKTGKSGKIWVTLAVVVLLTAGVAAGIRYRKMKQEAANPSRAAEGRDSSPGAGSSKSAAIEFSRGLQNGTPTGTPVTDPGAVPTPVGGAIPTETATNPAGGTSTLGTTSPTTTSPKPAGSTFTNPVVNPAAPTTAASTAAAKGALELQLHVSRATWLSIQADGKAPTTETLRDSATKTVVARTGS